VKYLVYVIRNQVTKEPIVWIRAPERVKEFRDNGKFSWMPGLVQKDGNTLMLFGRRMVFKNLISASVSFDDSKFWRDEHAEILLDFTKGGTDGENANAGGKVKRLGAKNRNAEKKIRHQKSAG
jgi:hypothetical protein